MATAVKICGITRVEDGLAAARAGAHAIGLVFHPASPRVVSAERAREIVSNLPPFVTAVGLFVDAPVEQVRAVLDAVPLQLLQFHGAEPPDYCSQFPLPYIKAVRVKEGVDLLQYAGRHRAAKGLLLDAFVDGSHGGTGSLFDWDLIPSGVPLPIVLAGGLTVENVTEAIRRVRPWAVDVSTGVEREKGIKDAAKIAAFIGERAMQMYEAGQIYDLPDANGHFGPFGGVFVAETLMHALDELRREYLRVREDASFQGEFDYELKHYVGRPSPIYHAKRLSEQLGGAQIWLKREDLNHTGAHKINNTVGQALVARRMGKRRVIAETGAGQHGVASATVAARYGMECVVYMGSEDIKRQAMNVYRMKLLGASVVPVESGSKTLKDALNEAMRDWVTNVENTFYIIGTVAGPHPYPMMVRDFNSVVGKELRAQMPEMIGRQPDAILACVGGGSNAMGVFHPYIQDTAVQLIGVEAAGEGIATGHHAATLCAGRPGVLHGNRTYLLQDEDGQIIETHSISAGLDYPGVGPEHSWLKDSGRAQYVAATDEEALHAFHSLCRTEGIMPALESSHALAHAMKIAPGMGKDKVLLVNLSGRGDKDMHTVAKHSGITL